VSIDRRLTCVEALRRLDSYLDDEVSHRDHELVEQHLRECEACAKKFGFEHALLDQLRGKLREVELPAQLKSRIMRTLASIP
jgi:anti-sigma factor (TIGR02949 family)